MSGLPIGKVAEQTGLAVDTIRYYERTGLIPEPARRPSGFRDYEPQVVARLHFIRHAKALGFSLREIAELLSLRVDEQRTCSDVYTLAAAKLADIDRRVAELRRMRNALARLAAECTGTGPTGDCPLLEALERENGA